MTQPPDLPPQDPTPTDAPQRGGGIADATVAASGFAWVVGRTGRWVTIGAWILALVATFAFGLSGKFADAETNESRNYLPADAESTKAYEAIDAILKADNVPFVAVVHRGSGLTAADKAKIAAQLERFNAQPASTEIRVKDADDGTTRAVTLEDAVRAQDAWLTLGDVSRDGQTALVIGAVKVTGDNDRLLDAIDALRSSVTPLRADGLTVKVTGGAGFSYDAVKVFSTLNGTLVGAVFALVLVLLLIIYRSPFVMWLPLVAVAVAEITSKAVGYAATEVGATVTGQSTAIMSVLVLGAGTDYALLIVARYREELRHHANRHDALRLAMQSAGPAVFASGLTVAAGVFTLTVASVKGTAGLGPLGAIGVAVAMLAMLTLLPALFAISPRGVFWPKTPKVGTEGGDATHGAFRKVGERIALRPRRTWVVTSALLLVCVAGLTTFSGSLSQSETFVGEVESVEGGELLAKSFPGGTSAPTQMVVPASASVPDVVSAVQGVKGVAAVNPAQAGEAGTLVNVTLDEDPYSTEAQELIPAVRAAAVKAGGDGVLVGGDTAINYDLAEANTRDLTLIIPIVLAVVFLILVGLLRAIVLPLVLIATVVLSFGAALGLSSLLWTQVLGFGGADQSIVLFAFVFLVALGIDYNIFLASRVREEALRHGTREGILRGLGATGAVITAAGVVLAGTFLVLAATPLVFLVEIGTAIAIGVVLDTFIVRSILAPAISLDLGDRIWAPWGSKIPRRDAPKS